MVGGWTISGIAELSEARGPVRERTDSVELLHSKAEHIGDAKRHDCDIRCDIITMLPFRSEPYKKEKPERCYRPTQAYLRSSVAAVRSSSDPLYSRIGRNPQNVPLTGLPVFPLKRWSRRRMWLPRRVKNTGQRCANCDPVPMRRPATGLNGERACGASLEPRGGGPKKSPRQDHATAWGRKPRAPEYASNDAKSSQIDFCVLDWPKRHRPPSIISEGRKGDSCVLRKKIARNSLQNESRSTEQMGQAVRRQQRRNA